MKKKFEHKESRGLPGGSNEMFTYVTSVFDIYQGPSDIEGQGMFAGKPFKKGDLIGLAHSNDQPASQLGRMHNHDENSPTMISKKSGNDRFVFAAKDLQPGDELTTNYRMQPELEQPEDFQFGGSITAPPRKGVRKNPDGSESTHLMATETLDGKNWFSFPTLFQDPDGTWIDMSDRPWEEAYEEAKRRGEVIEFGTDKEAAIKFGEGSWKLPSYQDKGEVPLKRSEVFNIPRTMGYENGEMVLQDKPIWDGMLDEVTITPYTQSRLLGEYQMANKATGGLEPVYPIFDVMTLGLKAPATAGAKAIQAGIKKAPSKINPKYYNPNTLAKGNPDVYYRTAGKDAFDDFQKSGFLRTQAEVTDQPIMGLLDTRREMDQVRNSIKEAGQFTYRHPSDFRAPYFSRGKTADMTSGGNDYLFQTRPGAIGDDAFSSGQMNILHGRGTSQVAPGGYGIMDPMQRGADNFDVFKKSWWHGYKPIKQDGGVVDSTLENFVRMSPIDISVQRSKEIPRATISQYEEPAWYEKAADYLASPMTSLGYLVRGQDLPDRIPINAENRNVFDMAFDVINPAAWHAYAESADRNIAEGNYTAAAFDAMAAIPLIPSSVSKGSKVVKATKGAPQLYKKPYRALDKMLDMEGARSFVTEKPMTFTHTSPNPALSLDNIKTTETIPVGKRPKAGKRIIRDVEAGVSDPRNAPAGFYTISPEVGVRSTFAGSGSPGNYRYSFEMPAGSRVLDFPGGTSVMSVGNLQEALDMGYDVIRGNDMGVGVEFLPLNKSKMSGFRGELIKKYGGSLPKAQGGIEVEPASRRIRYEDGRMKLQDPAIYDGMLDEVVVTPYTQSELAWQENRANQATGGLQPVYPLFEIMTAGLKAPATAGAKAAQSALTSEKTLGALARSRYVPKFTKTGLIKNYKSKFPNVDLRGTGSGNYSKLGVNELGLGVDDFGSLTNYERSAISQVNQTQPADEVFNTFVQRYADFNTDDALANQLADFSRRNPRTKFEMNLGRDATPSKRMQEIFDDPELNVHNVFSYESSGPMTFTNKWGSQSRRFYDNSARDAAGEFEKNLRSYGQQGFYAANVPMGKPVKQALTYNKNGRVFDYVTETLPVSDFAVNKGLMNPDVIGNLSRYRGAGDMANQHNFLLGITNSPSVIISGNKGFAGLKGGNKIREKIGGLITPAGGKAVSPHNKKVVPLLKQEFNLSKPFEGTFIKSPSKLETYYNSAGKASPYTNFPGVLDIDDLFTTGKSNLAKGGQLPKAQDGGEETSWTDYINPMNWGVPNKDEAGDFKQAFRAARVDGDDEFMWHGERYNTELAPTPEKPKEEKLFYNKDILKGLSEEQTARRQSLLNAANAVVSAQGDNDNLRKLLVMSAVMENTLGADPKAYGRDYTRSPMSIDDIAYDDLFNLREGARDYTAQQKKNASWLEGLGINASDVDSLLRADDPMASMAVARLVYGRAPEALPSGDDPDALYNYYLKYYNKGGLDKYGGAEAHRKKFNDYYNQIYREFGGETDQLKIYKDYVYGVYDGTEMQSKAEKVYDKLNRVYYKEAKKQGMRVPNYIMTNVIKQIDN